MQHVVQAAGLLGSLSLLSQLPEVAAGPFVHTVVALCAVLLIVVTLITGVNQTRELFRRGKAAEEPATQGELVVVKDDLNVLNVYAHTNVHDLRDRMNAFRGPLAVLENELASMGRKVDHITTTVNKSELRLERLSTIVEKKLGVCDEEDR